MMGCVDVRQKYTAITLITKVGLHLYMSSDVVTVGLLLIQMAFSFVLSLSLPLSDSSESDEDVSEDVSEEVFRSRVYGLTAASSPPTSPPPLVPPHRSTLLPSLLHPRHRRHSHSHPPLREEDFAIHSWKQPNNVRGWGERIVGSRSKSPQSDLNRSPAGSPPLRPTPGRQGVKRPPPPKPPRGVDATRR